MAHIAFQIAGMLMVLKATLRVVDRGATASRERHGRCLLYPSTSTKKEGKEEERKRKERKGKKCKI